jgi:hypothetical protein
MRRHLLPLVTVLTFVVTAAQPATAATTTPSRLLGTLTVTAEPARTGYDRELFDHWIDADGDGCDTRYEVLIAQSTTPVRVETGCSLNGGTWKSIYDNVTTTRSSSFDVDHVVALAEAWDSGASRWDAATRRAFANDLDSPYSLIAVTAASNRSKSDYDAARWQPTTKAGRCWLATATIVTKWRWSLTVDTAEKAALSLVLNTCGSVKLILPKVASPVSTASPTITPTPNPTSTRSTLPAGTPTPVPTRSATTSPAPISSPVPTATPTSSPVKSSITPLPGGACPQTHPVKGNISSTGKIYHVPGGPYYSRTEAENCFLNESAAVAAGFRAPR